MRIANNHKCEIHKKPCRKYEPCPIQLVVVDIIYQLIVQFVERACLHV